MKQQITKEQWNELSDEEKEKYLDEFKRIYGGGANVPSEISADLPTLGQLIEYLGDDLHSMEQWDENGKFGWSVFPDLQHNRLPLTANDKLIDALWEATKHKLNNK